MKFCYSSNFTLPKQSQRSRSYKTGLDLWDCFGREKTLSYNRRNKVINKTNNNNSNGCQKPNVRQYKVISFQLHVMLVVAISNDLDMGSLIVRVTFMTMFKK